MIQPQPASEETIECGVQAMIATLARPLPDDCPSYQHAVVSAVLKATTPMAGKDAAAAWGDRDDEMSAAIRASHPTETGRHDLYARAMTLVGNRRSKSALVGLVNHLIAQNEALAREKA